MLLIINLDIFKWNPENLKQKKTESWKIKKQFWKKLVVGRYRR